MHTRTAAHNKAVFQSTPSARRATSVVNWLTRCVVISIHALREESDGTEVGFSGVSYNFNPRPPRGERRLCQGIRWAFSPISIHALREESDSDLKLIRSISS